MTSSHTSDSPQATRALIEVPVVAGISGVYSVASHLASALDGTGPAIVPTTTPAPAPTKTATPPPVKSINGTFTGPVVNVSYGNVQVEITVSNGQITDARALQAPSGRNDRYTNFALPILKEQTLAAQSTNIQGASGASYTTYGWRKSLQGAIAKAGI